MTTSIWRVPRDSGAHEADVIVVGSGVCGVSAALAFERRGADTVVLERHTLASGASSRAAGFLMRGAAENYARAIEQWGRDTARAVWRWTEENLEGLRDEGIAALPSYRDVPSCLLALEEDERGELERSLGLLREDGFAVSWIDRGDDSVWKHGKPLGGLLNPRDAAANPLHLVQHLASRLKRPVEEQQEVVSIGPASRGRLRVTTGSGDWLVKRVLLALNAYLPLLVPSFSAIVQPKRGQMLAIRSPGLRLDCSYYANHGYEYFRQLPDGTVVVGGRRGMFAEAEVGYEDRTTPDVQGALERFAGEMLGLKPAQMNIVSRWAGTMGFSPDGLPLVGPIAGDWPESSVWFCGAFTGHGMSLGHRTARAAVEAMLDGTPTPFPLSRVNQA
jgi:gamma-glutamylputrescine oxidase